MKVRNFWLSFVTLLLLNTVAVEVSAQKVFKGIILRSQEKVLIKNKYMRNNGANFDPNEVFVKMPEIHGYELFSLSVTMDYSAEAYPYRNNRYLQEDIAKCITGKARNNQRVDSLEKVMRGYMQGAKSLDDIFKRLKKVKGYDKFVYDDMASFTDEISTYKDGKCNKHGLECPMEIEVKNGILKLESLSVYDVETGKKIKPSDLLTTVKFVKEYSKDTVTMVSVTQIDARSIIVHGEEGSNYSEYLSQDDSLLTPYAKSLMARDKGHWSSTRTNKYGDLIQTIYVKKINGGFESREILIPVQLNGCQNTQKIRNRMLEVMFGSSDVNSEDLIAEGVKKWVPKSEIGKRMVLSEGEGVISFGFENLSKRNRDKDTFIVFDKTTGEEITVKDLIKDKKGFLDYVNSFNMYYDGFLFDSMNVKRGPNVPSHLLSTGGTKTSFNGWKEFPTSWRFKFSKIDKFIPVEFNTKDSRIFLNYNDIKAFIDPKYHEMLDRAVKSIGR